MSTLTVTALGYVTLPMHALQHVGIAPGETIELDLLPNGRVAFGSPKRLFSGSAGNRQE